MQLGTEREMVQKYAVARCSWNHGHEYRHDWSVLLEITQNHYRLFHNEPTTAVGKQGREEEHTRASPPKSWSQFGRHWYRIEYKSHTQLVSTTKEDSWTTIFSLFKGMWTQKARCWHHHQIIPQLGLVCRALFGRNLVMCNFAHFSSFYR